MQPAHLIRITLIGLESAKDFGEGLGELYEPPKTAVAATFEIV